MSWENCFLLQMLLIMSLLSDGQFLPLKSAELLLQKILGTIPALTRTIAPDGFTKSPFFYYYHQKLAEEYQMYRRIRVMRFKFDRWEKKAIVRNPALLTIEEFAKEFKLTPHHLPDEIIALLGELFFRVAGKSCRVYDQYGCLYDFGDPDQYEDLFQKIVIETCVTSRKPFPYSAYVHHTYKISDEEVDVTLVYKHIFRFLKSEGLDWQFREFYFDFLLGLQREIEAKNPFNGDNDEFPTLGHLESIASFLQIGVVDPSTGEIVYPDFGTEFVNYNNKKGPILKAYIEVYGHNPYGFPPKMTDYI